jgi:hypothetical protein
MTMGCNCTKNNATFSKPTRTAINPKGRGVNNGKVTTKIQRVMRRQIK